MVLRDLGPADDAAARRERFLRLAEGRMGEAAGAAIRQFLRNVLAAVTPESLTAATGDVPTSLRLFTLGEAAGWWDDAVADHVVDEVRAVWRAGYFDTRDGDLLASDQRAIDDYLANVTDRLSTTATPTIPEQAFDIARSALADEVARSSSIDDIALRLAQDFSWDADATLARRRLAETDSRIDAILDAIGPPGDPAREAARLGGDAEVARLQEERREWIRQRDRTRSEWQTRAERIARTETCGAYNAGAIDAAFVEGQAVKVWMGTGDERTRDEHLAAAGQCVPIEDRFTVGGEALVMPGDPQGSPGMIINCRCTVVFADSCEQAASRYARSREAIDRERDARGLAHDDQPPGPSSVEPDYATVADVPAGQINRYQEQALTDYQAGSDQVNDGLRSGTDPLDLPFEERLTAVRLERLIDAQAPLERDVRVYRGLTDTSFLRDGQTLTDRAFVSTTGDVGTARAFAGSAGEVVEVIVPAGTRALNVDEALATRGVQGWGEDELLLQRVSTFDVSRSATGWVLRLVG